MTRWITRQQAGLRAPTSPGATSTGASGVVIHYLGAGTWADKNPVELWRQVQGWHLNHPTENYRDIAYNLGVAPGVILEGRSTLTTPNVRPGATGSANPTTLAVCVLVGAGDPAPSQHLLDTVAEAVAWLRDKAGAARRVSGHRDWMSTACPGQLYPHLATISARATAIQTPPVGDPVVATYNAPHRIGRAKLTRDFRRLAGQGVGLVAVQECTDSDVPYYAKQLGWDWWRPDKARSAGLIFDPDEWQPIRREGRRLQGAYLLEDQGAPRYIVWALLSHVPTGRVYRIGSAHLPAFKTRSVTRARQFRKAERRAGAWLRRGRRRVLLGDMNANQGPVWTPTLIAEGRWETPRLATHGRKRIDHVIASRCGPIHPVALSTMEGASDHRALIVRLKEQ